MRFVAPAQEIKEYLVSFAKNFSLYPHIKVVQCTHSKQIYEKCLQIQINDVSIPSSKQNARTQFNTRVLSATWLEETRDWEVSTANETLRCKILISAVGALHKPNLPDIPGVGAFDGGAQKTGTFIHVLLQDQAGTQHSGITQSHLQERRWFDF